MNFAHRDNALELLDGDHIPAADIRLNMVELDKINRWLGGHAITRSGFRELAGRGPAETICEIGCGGGDNLLAIQQITGRKQPVRCIGIDHNPDCIAVAESRSWRQKPQLICSDYRSVVFEQSPDIIFTSLFCHHLSEEDLVPLFRNMRSKARTGFFINDLHRHPLAYYSIRWLTGLFSRSYLVKNDAPLSVRRGFSRSELKSLLEAAGITNYSIRWRWAFRWLVIVPT